ncbi:MAG: META domain-containing protein [Anaerolineae bacterium]|uniref:META domain-containing protein n=1 Tax=Promineifilum sp. TaxID=2664178 RepID=UPI001DCE8CDC|nr:META domain-containing protein [Anaerolineales bacterium]MCB8934774.1 META domain-containing protein [Promineifilum sp.]MCO5182064.1 META domain-containing protein [Promineifilum sp.]MCW5847165.1 META domain-containing protein [Anaerolineae bacterium]
MKRLLLITSLVLLVALAACSNQPPANPTAEPVVEAIPTEVPPTEVPPTAEPTAEPAPAFEADPALIDTLWLWTSRDAAEPLDVANPENYNLLFNDDGTFFAGLDCNRGSGTYATPGDGTISMELGPITRALCAEESLSNTMIAMFPEAVAYTLEHEGEVLAITLADGSVDRYRRADTMTEAMPPLKDADTGLIDRVWQWTTREAGGRTTSVAAPDNYTLTFNGDGSFYARLDCNTGGGSYSSDAPGSLTLSMVRTTLALCPPESMAGEMSTLFEQTVAYAIAGDNRTLTLTHEDGTVDTYVSATAEAPTLGGTTWQWLGTTTPEEPITVADASRYTIEFLDDGTAAIQADCNRVVAQFTAEDGALSIIPGPMTLAACPDDSQGDVFVQQLGASGLYFFQDGDLYIDLFADAGTMRFGAVPEVDLPEPAAGAAVGTVNAPDGVFLRTGPGANFAAVGAAPLGESGTLAGISEDGAWYVLEAPAFPNGQVWVAAAFVDAENAGDLPVVATPVNVPAQSLVGPTWLWTGTTTPVEIIDVAGSSRYTIDFFEDGTAGIGADCNRVIATWTADGQSITITPGPSTLAACPDDSQADAFIQQLSNAAVFFFQGDDLFIDQVASAGTLRFTTSVLPVAPGQPAETPGLPFRVVSFGPTGAEQPLIEGTHIEAVFDQTGGTVSGTSGCNNYSGPMKTADGGFALGPFVSTAMACLEPAGVMEQEAAYLAALAGATGFQWSVQPNSFITNGQITYALPDGTTGAINLVSP